MAIKIVVVDAAQLPGGVEFPPLALEKYGWAQYPQLVGEALAERCWRADIVINLASTIDTDALERMEKLGLLVCVGRACEALDQTAILRRGIELLAFPEADLSDPASAQDVCTRVSAAIDHYLARCQPGGGAA